MKNEELECEIHSGSEGEEGEAMLAEFDELIGFISALPRCKSRILYAIRVSQMEFSEKMLRHVLHKSCCEATVDCKQLEFEPSIGVITVEGEDIVIHDMIGYARAVEFADNLEIYALDSGKVRMTLTFHGVTKPYC